MAEQKLLELKNITKEFPGTKALDRVNLSVSAGEVVALLGENGAGKSTLMKILSGVWVSGTYEGEIYLQGNLVKFDDTRAAFASGIAMIHQELSVFPELTVAEHLELDQLESWIDWNQLFQRTQKFLDGLGFGLKAQSQIKSLSIGNRQLVEIARALYRKAKILVFDEPTSALTEQEVSRLYEIVDQLRKDGHAIIYITHRMDEVFRLADRMVVLRDGANAGECSAFDDKTKLAREQLEPRLISWMVGRSIQDIYPPRNNKILEELIRVDHLSLISASGKTLLKDIQFSVKRGEVLGLGGLLGAGRSEIFQALFGALQSTGPSRQTYKISGNVRVLGKEIGSFDRHRPLDAIRLKMAYVSEDRKGNGLILNHSIRDNLVLPSLSAKGSKVTRSQNIFSTILSRSEKTQSAHWVKELKVRHSSMMQNIGTLSGGNQQKVVLGKWLMIEPDLLFLDEPTRGIDIGAKVEIYHWIQNLAAKGMAIVLASSEMPELLGLCHRILVLREGHVSAELDAQTATQEKLMKAASL